MSRLVTRLTVAVAASGALLGAAAMPAAAADHGRHAPQRSQVVLGEVQHDSPGRHAHSESLNAEWVAVVNNGRRSVDLTNWTLSDTDRHSYRFRHLRLAGHASVRVHTGTGHDTDADVYQDRHASIWNNGGGTATLRDDRGRVVDTESWGRGDDRDRRDRRDGRDGRDRHDGSDGRGRHDDRDHRDGGDSRDGRDHRDGRDGRGRGDDTDSRGRDHAGR